MRLLLFSDSREVSRQRGLGGAADSASRDVATARCRWLAAVIRDGVFYSQASAHKQYTLRVKASPTGTPNISFIHHAVFPEWCAVMWRTKMLRIWWEVINFDVSVKNRAVSFCPAESISVMKWTHCFFLTFITFSTRDILSVSLFLCLKIKLCDAHKKSFHNVVFVQYVCITDSCWSELREYRWVSCFPSMAISRNLVEQLHCGAKTLRHFIAAITSSKRFAVN